MLQIRFNSCAELHCVNSAHFIHCTVVGNLCFPVWGYLNNALRIIPLKHLFLLDIGMHFYSEYTQDGFVGSRNMSVCSLSRPCNIVCQSGCISLHSHHFSSGVVSVHNSHQVFENSGCSISSPTFTIVNVISTALMNVLQSE